MKQIMVLLLLTAFTGTVHAQTGVIKETSGAVELKAALSTDFIPAKTGDTVAKDTVVSTGFKSTALITVGNSTIMVRPLTRLVFSEILEAQGGETLNIKLQSGRVRIDVQPPAGKRAEVTVISPTATASVRGTSFDIDTRTLRVSKGTVIFQGGGGPSMPVSAGSSSSIGPAGRAADPLDNDSLSPAPPMGAGAARTGSNGLSASPANTTYSFVFTFEK